MNKFLSSIENINNLYLHVKLKEHNYKTIRYGSFSVQTIWFLHGVRNPVFSFEDLETCKISQQRVNDFPVFMGKLWKSKSLDTVSIQSCFFFFFVPIRFLSTYRKGIFNSMATRKENVYGFDLSKGKIVLNRLMSHRSDRQS